MLKCCHMNYFVFPKAGENLEDAPNSIFGGISGGLLQHDHLCTLPCTHPPFSAGFSTVLWGGVVVGNWPGAQFCGNRRGLRGEGGTRGADTLWQREQVAVRAAPWLLQVAITALLSLRVTPLHDAGAVPAQPRASVPFRRLFGGQQHLSQAPDCGLSPASRRGAPPRGCAYGGDRRLRPAECLSAGYVSLFSSLPPLPFPVYLSRSTHIYINF